MKTFTGVADEIKELIVEDDFNIRVTFQENGSYLVSKIMNQEAFASLRHMNAGEKVLLATNAGELIWVKPQ